MKVFAVVVFFFVVIIVIVLIWVQVCVCSCVYTCPIHRLTRQGIEIQEEEKRIHNIDFQLPHFIPLKLIENPSKIVNGTHAHHRAT